MTTSRGLLRGILAGAAGRRKAGAGPPPAPFIVGAPRSGTTLLRLMLDAHPELCIPPETGFLPDAAALRGRGGALRRAFFETVTGTRSWADINLTRERFAAALEEIEPFTVTEGARAFYRAYAARFGKPRWGDKTPLYCLHMVEIERILPEARFVHIIRDGRDVALSLRGLWFSPGDDVEELAAHWRTWLRTARRLGRGRRHYMEVRYEELIADAPAVLRKVCEFVRLDYDPRMERYYERSGERLDEVKTVYRPDGTLLISKEERLHNHRFATRPPEPSRVHRWREEMDAETRSRFAAVAGDLLGELGYPHA